VIRDVPRVEFVTVRDAGLIAIRNNGASLMSDSILEKLNRLEALMMVLVERQTVREWYSTDEVARLVGKAEFTVREWCRLGRIHAEKRMSGRGAFPAWVVSHVELQRYQREGLLPERRPA
jgi:Helix-turn-helix domain